MKFHKRQLILASLVAALGTAVYLNWQFSSNKNLGETDIIESTRELGEARYVNSANIAGNIENGTTENMDDNIKKFFAQAYSNRQKAKEESEEKLKSLVSETNINAEIKNEITRQIEDIAKNSQQESSIENLIKAKGFEDCIVSIQNGECSVIVSPGKLDENSVIVIRDIACGQSGISYDKIKITEAK